MSVHMIPANLKCDGMLVLVICMLVFFSIHDYQVVTGSKRSQMQTWTKSMAWSQAYSNLDTIRVITQQTFSHLSEKSTSMFCCLELRLLQCC
jgi:hypothetical protein